MREPPSPIIGEGMAVSLPDMHESRSVAGHAGLIGIALGIVVYSGAGLILYDSGGLLVGTTGLVATLLFALGMGIWAGAPAARDEQLPLTERWIVAGVATALAGSFSTYWSLYGNPTDGFITPFLALLLLIACPLYALGLILPVLLEFAERAHEDREDADDGDWGPLGSVCLGVFVGAIAGVLLSGLVFIPRAAPGPILLILAVALLVPSLKKDAPKSGAEEILFERGTPYGVLRVVEIVYPGQRQPERRLLLNGEVESGETVRGGAPTLSYVAAAEALLADITSPGAEYLFLGGGAYTLPRRIAERDPDAEITVVELDPAVTQVAYKFFGLQEEHGITSVHGDARAFLDTAPTRRFDRMYVDVYGGAEALPHSLLTVEALERASAHLDAGGCLTMNLIGSLAGDEAPRFWSVVETLRQVFPTVQLYLHFGQDFPDRQNVLIVASHDQNLRLPDRAGLFERLAEESRPQRDAVILRDLQEAVTLRDPSSSVPSA